MLSLSAAARKIFLSLATLPIHHVEGWKSTTLLLTFPRRARASKRSDIIFLRSISGTGQLRRMCGLHKHKQTNVVRGVTKNIPSRPEASESMFRSIRAAMNGLSLVWFAAPNAAHVIVPDSCGPRVAGALRPTTAQDSRTPQGFWLLIMIKARIWLQLYLGRSAIGHCLGRTIRITNLAYRSTLSWEHCDLSLTLQGNVTPPECITIMIDRATLQCDN